MYLLDLVQNSYPDSPLSYWTHSALANQGNLTSKNKFIKPLNFFGLPFLQFCLPIKKNSLDPPQLLSASTNFCLPALFYNFYP